MGNRTPVTAWALLACLAASTPAFAADVIAEVNGEAITSDDLEHAYNTLGVTGEQRETLRANLVDALIEQRLMHRYLADRGAKAAADDVEGRLRQALKQMEGPVEPAAKERVRRQIELSLMWQDYLRTLITPEQLAKFFESRREQFDGTRVHARQVFRKLPEDAAPGAVTEAEALLRRIKQDVEAGRTTFADAAREHSEAPTAAAGGDVGWFRWRGGLPADVSEAAFALKAGQVSDPVRSPLGVHLVQVVEREPGRLSLEDVRPAVYNALAKTLWREIAERQRQAARITRTEQRPSE